MRSRLTALLAGVAVAGAAVLGGTALADPAAVEDALLERDWFVGEVVEDGDTTTIRFGWTDSYFAANACREARAAAGGAPPARVRVAFGDEAPRTCAQVVANPAASIIATAPADDEEPEGG